MEPRAETNQGFGSVSVVLGLRRWLTIAQGLPQPPHGSPSSTTPAYSLRTSVADDPHHLQTTTMATVHKIAQEGFGKGTNELYDR